MFGCDRWRAGQAVLLLSALLGGLAACLFFFYIPAVIRRSVNEQVVLGRDKDGNLTSTTKAWADPRYTMRMSVWTFSVQNTDDVVKRSAKPLLVEKGPYVFREVQHKKFEFAANGTRVFYRNYKTYFFNQSASCATCSLDDKITVPNIVLQTIIDKLPNSRFAKAILDVLLRGVNETVFVTTSVREFLFDGYLDPLVAAFCSKPLIHPFCRAQKVPDRVGLFFGDGLYEIGSGLGDVAQVSRVFSFNQKNHTNAYYGDRARQIKGSDGQMFPPGLDARNSSVLDIFVGPLCRSIQMERTGSRQFEQVPVYDYEPARNMHDIDLQRFLGFCNPQAPMFFNNSYAQQSGCAPVGLMDVSSCLEGNPRIYISQPHFLGCHPAVHDALDGLRPPSAEDKTSLGIEPLSATVVVADQRTQLNLGLLNGGLNSLAGLPPRIVPMVWLQEWASFDDGTREQLQALTGYRSSFFLASVGAFLLTCACVVGFGALLVCQLRRQVSAGRGMTRAKVQQPADDQAALLEESEPVGDVEPEAVDAQE